MSSLLYLMLILRCAGINLGIFHSVDAQFNTPVFTNLIVFDSLSTKNILANCIGALPGLFYKSKKWNSLQEFGHYVRLATHVNFRTFVKSAGIDFYPLGGDPRIMAQCMVLVLLYHKYSVVFADKKHSGLYNFAEIIKST